MQKNSVVEIVRPLNGSGARYLIAGGLAVVAHGYLLTLSSYASPISHCLKSSNGWSKRKKLRTIFPLPANR